MAVYDEIAKNLMNLITEKDTNAYQISKIANVSPSVITRFLARETGSINLNILLDISKYYNISLDYFMGNVKAETAETQNSLISVEYFDSVRISAGFGIENFNETPDGYDMLPARFFKNIKNMENIKCMRVSGNSMLPAFDDGDYIFVDISQRVITPEQGIYVISIDGELYVKGVQKIPGGFQLLSYNKNYEPIVVTAEKYNPDSVIAIGRVVAAFTLKNYY